MSKQTQQKCGSCGGTGRTTEVLHKARLLRKDKFVGTASYGCESCGGAGKVVR